MLEIKLIKTSLLGRTVFAQIMGARIIAEPDAKKGIWWEKNGEDIYAIIHKDDVDELNIFIQLLNKALFSRRISLEEKGKLVYKSKWFKACPEIHGLIGQLETSE